MTLDLEIRAWAALEFRKLRNSFLKNLPVDSKAKMGEHSNGVMSRVYTFLFVRKTLFLELVNLEFILFLIARGTSIL
jgi:hypothetical protein